MNTNELNIDNFLEILTEKKLLTIRILQIALVTGVSIFLAIVFILASNQPVQETPDLDMMNILSTVHLCMAIVAYIAAFVAFRFIVNPKRVAGSMYLANASENTVREEQCLSLIVTGTIIRLALLEGVSFFGLVICFLAGQNGVMNQNPEYWLNTFSYFIFLLFTIATFATKDKLENIFIKRFMMEY